MIPNILTSIKASDITKKNQMDISNSQDLNHKNEINILQNKISCISPNNYSFENIIKNMLKNQQIFEFQKQMNSQLMQNKNIKIFVKDYDIF